MKQRVNVFFVAAGMILVPAMAHASQIGIGELFLNSDGLGLQSVSVSNLSGATNGCGQIDPSLPVCNSVNFTNWTMTITFLNPDPSNPNLPSSPLVFHSDGTAADYIGPDQNFPTGYSGEASNPWSLALLQNASGCPPCDAQITRIQFQATLDTTLLQTSTDGSTPYTSFFADPNISVDYLVPASVYDSGSPTGSVQIFASSAADPAPQVPEPGSATLLLFLSAGAYCVKRLRARR